MLYYTGALEPGDIQAHAENSLGGYISKSPIANGRINSVFSDVIASNAQRTTRILAFRNLSKANVLSIHLTASDSVHQFKGALVTASLDDDCNNAPYFETLLSDDALPFYAVPINCVGEENKITLTDLADQEWVGIILIRETTSNNASNTLATLAAAYKADPISFSTPKQPTVEELTLIIETN